MDRRNWFVLCFCFVFAGCVSSPYLSEARRDAETERGEERWRRLQEQTHGNEVFLDDGSLSEALCSPYENDSTLDADMRLVLECRDAVERESGGAVISRDQWFSRFVDILWTRSNGAARIERAARGEFHAPETIAEEAWCFWYVRDNRRREITVDPKTRELAQAFEWRER